MSRLRKPKLRTQVLAGVLSITLIALAAFDVAAVGVLHRYLLGQTDEKLQAALTVTQPRLGVIVSEASKRAVPVIGAYNLAFVPAGHQKRPVLLEYGIGGMLPVVPARQHGGFLAKDRTMVNKVSQIRAATWVVQTIRVQAGTLVASTSLSDVNATVGRFRLIVIIGSAMAGLLIFGGVVLVMRRGLRPIETMAEQADRISAADLSDGVDLTDRVDLADARSEVGRLGTALNGMLTRIEASVAEREAGQQLMRRFFADASHELRTPLASLRANAELYQQGALRQGAQVDEAMRRIALEAQRMSRLVDDMLRLARLDQHPGSAHEPVDLGDLVASCVRAASAADQDRTWQTEIDEALITVGDEELLRRAVGNLLANVRAHTPAGTVATVTATCAGDGICLQVSDDGPGVPPALLPRIFDRFYRADAPSHRPGSGLGLAIVAEIATAHHGIAAAAASEPHGLCITLTLPLLPYDQDENVARSGSAPAAGSRALITPDA